MRTRTQNFRPYAVFCTAIISALLPTACAAIAQQPNAAPVAPIAAQQGFGNQNVNFGLGPGGGMGAGNNTTTGGGGGAASADFDSLIDLITSTVSTETWAETGGGEAEIRPFPTGVMVDATGALKLVKATAPSAELAARRGTTPPSTEVARLATANPRRASKLRFVSLPRLEREIVRRQDAGESLDVAMLTLAGLQRVEYVFVYPESHDLVLAGPAGDWQVGPFGRIVSTETGAPVVRLDDLLTILRRSGESSQSYFGCMINPRQAALAETQAYLDRTAARAIKPSERDAWLEQIRTTLGRQDVELFGIDPTSRIARVLVEADVHMKLIGMGLEDGVPGVENYLDAAADSAAPPAAMSVLRWWFALHYAAINTAPDGNAYQLIGPGVRVLSENEILAAQGQRVHTGQSDPLNQQFAESFTAHFAALAEKYPIYGELRNIFDLSLAVALIQQDKLADRAGWQPTRLVDHEKLRLPGWPAPREVDTVANCVVANRRTIIAGVSGGVMIAPTDVLANRHAETSTTLAIQRSDTAPADAASAWWWDATAK
jgi:hypothetical protein